MSASPVPVYVICDVHIFVCILRVDFISGNKEVLRITPPAAYRFCVRVFLSRTAVGMSSPLCDLFPWDVVYSVSVPAY